MIVRIQGEGQYRLDDAAIVRINELDEALEAALDGGDFAAALAALLDHVRAAGAPVADDEIITSEVILPAADATAAEVAAMLTDEGLVPD